MQYRYFERGGSLLLLYNDLIEQSSFLVYFERVYLMSFMETMHKTICLCVCGSKIVILFVFLYLLSFKSITPWLLETLCRWWPWSTNHSHIVLWIGCNSEPVQGTYCPYCFVVANYNGESLYFVSQYETIGTPIKRKMILIAW